MTMFMFGRRAYSRGLLSFILSDGFEWLWNQTIPKRLITRQQNRKPPGEFDANDESLLKKNNTGSDSGYK